jgi:hypothetical protein
VKLGVKPSAKVVLRGQLNHFRAGLDFRKGSDLDSLTFRGPKRYFEVRQKLTKGRASIAFRVPIILANEVLGIIGLFRCQKIIIIFRSWPVVSQAPEPFDESLTLF